MRDPHRPADPPGFDPHLAHATAGGPRAPLAIVIGSGFGGLAAAVRLACRGWRVQVLEKLDGPGGRAYVWHLDGYTFDAGPTIITMPQMFEELWSLCGRRLADDVKLQLMDPFYRVRFDDGTHFDYTNDPQAMRVQVERISPADVAGYEGFIRQADLCYRIGFEELGSIAYNSLADLAYAVPSLIRMRGWRTLHGMVASYMKHPKLRVVFSLQSLLIGGNPFAVTGVYSLINSLERRFGVYSALGGTGALVRGLVELARGRGVDFRYGAEVRRIVVEGGRATGVELGDGERIAADIVVSNGDTAWTYGKLIEPQHRRVWTDRKLARSRYSMSLFVWYFGTDRTWPEVPHHTMVLGPRYKGLLDDIFKRHRLADDFSLYLHRPTATDPSVAPPGCDTFYALSPVPHLASGIDWPSFAETYRRRVQARLEATMLPGLSRHIVRSHITTPQDFHDRLLSYRGAAFGMEPVLLQSAWFRPHNRSEDVDRLFMVGAGTHPGAGVPGVLMSARALEQVLPDVRAFA
jgi:phytoene desaturase